MRFEDLFEQDEVFLVGFAHGTGHHGGKQAGKAAGHACIAEGHAGLVGPDGLPGVGGLHGKWPLGGRHDELLVGNQFFDLVGVSEPAAEKVGHKSHLRAHSQGWRGLPLCGFDVDIPGRGMVGMGGVLSHHGQGPVDEDFSEDIYFAHVANLR